MLQCQDGGCVVLKIAKKTCVKIDVRELLHRTPEIWLMGVYPFRYVRPDQKKQVLRRGKSSVGA